MSRPAQRFRIRKRRDPGHVADADEVAAAREIVIALEKVDRTASLYPAGSPTIVGFADELFTKASALLARTRIVDFTISANEIEYQDEVVHDGAKQDRSLAFTLEDGGVRRLVLIEGLERSEVGALVDALAEARGKNAEDLVTLLWERDLRHVGFVAASVYADPEEETALADLDEDVERTRLLDRLKARQVALDQIATIRAGAHRAAAETTAATGAAEIADVLSLRPEEESGLRRWIDEERDITPALRQAEVLLMLLDEAAGDERLRERLVSVAKAIETLLDDGEPISAAELLAAVRRAAEASPASARAHTAGGPIRTFYQTVACRANGERLARFLARSHDEESIRAVRLFILGCGKHSLVLAADLLGVGADDASIVRALATACGDDLGEVRAHVADPTAKVAIAALRVLSEAVGESGLDDYRNALQHRDARVRGEALFAIARCRDPRALDALVDSLGDPEAEVRIMALKAFPSSAPQPRGDLYQRVQRLVEDDKARETRSRAEQDLLFATLARLDPDRGYRFLEETIHSYPFLNRERAHKRRLHALAALGELATSRSEAFLHGVESGAKTVEVRAAARAAIERIGTVRRTVKIIRRPGMPPSEAPAGTGAGDRSGPIGAASGAIGGASGSIAGVTSGSIGGGSSGSMARPGERSDRMRRVTPQPEREVRIRPLGPDRDDDDGDGGRAGEEEER